MGRIEELRRSYHKAICAQVIFLKSGVPSMADVGSAISKKIALNLLAQLPYAVSEQELKGQTAGQKLEELTRDFLAEAFTSLQYLRPGRWHFSVHGRISDFEQYRHLHDLTELVKVNKTLKTALGDYVIAPDIVVARYPLDDVAFNTHEAIVDSVLPQLTPLRANNNTALLLHASISCKWTLRSDRSQNARTEGLNLIRNRKGHTPRIAVVTGEPMPNRIASLALGTGDIDCVYHFALHELIAAIVATGDGLAQESLMTMVEGHRLRDISDLPFDLVI
jgi:hypothetical protein